MKLPVGPIDWTPEERAEYAQTGKLPERTVDAPPDPIRDRYRLEGELEGRREGHEMGFRGGREEGHREARSAHQRQAGKKSAEAQRAKMERWQTHAKELMLAILAEDPNLSSEKVAQATSTRWTLNERCPGHKTLADFVRKERPKK